MIIYYLISLRKNRQSFIKNAFSRANLDDPILVLHWNPEWLQNEANLIVRDQTITIFWQTAVQIVRVQDFYFTFRHIKACFSVEIPCA